MVSVPFPMFLVTLAFRRYLRYCFVFHSVHSVLGGIVGVSGVKKKKPLLRQQEREDKKEVKNFQLDYRGDADLVPSSAISSAITSSLAEISPLKQHSHSHSTKRKKKTWNEQPEYSFESALGTAAETNDVELAGHASDASEDEILDDLPPLTGASGGSRGSATKDSEVDALLPPIDGDERGDPRGDILNSDSDYTDSTRDSLESSSSLLAQGQAHRQPSRDDSGVHQKFNLPNMRLGEDGPDLRHGHAPPQANGQDQPVHMTHQHERFVSFILYADDGCQERADKWVSPTKTKAIALPAVKPDIIYNPDAVPCLQYSPIKQDYRNPQVLIRRSSTAPICYESHRHR